MVAWVGSMNFSCHERGTSIVGYEKELLVPTTPTTMMATTTTTMMMRTNLVKW